VAGTATVLYVVFNTVPCKYYSKTEIEGDLEGDAEKGKGRDRSQQMTTIKSVAPLSVRHSVARESPVRCHLQR
jgi:hypothetical protein